ncbi:hypothetical protein BJF89_16130 [Corynebacterium sp. CNJ-954]|uniref:(2Fe-2S)-binding protein n=1 Tax=Corynebacterium sp. CNJ-954 TaxID=1904962 RepID=UPI0009595713|nr:(2Fe-2S)-binding protein [Corynebacterium sp. CNJ-954]OLT55280.1 hypothetical protein BJF89_16130 [Corynebacterium sp. CNJ-954]
MTEAPRDSSLEMVSITVDGAPMTGRRGQSIAGVMLASGLRAWRTTAATDSPRGLFCGIGVCFDCLVTVDGVRDVRACQRQACEGDIVDFQDDGKHQVDRGDR